MIEEQSPEITIRVENATEAVKGYLSKMGWGVKQVKPIPDKRTNSRPRVNVDWTLLQEDLLVAIDKWCAQYGYQALSTRIKTSQNTKPTIQNTKPPIQNTKPTIQNTRQTIQKARTRNGSQTSEKNDNSDIIVQPRLQHEIKHVDMNTPATPRNTVRTNKGFSIRAKPTKRF